MLGYRLLVFVLIVSTINLGCSGKRYLSFKDSNRNNPTTKTLSSAESKPSLVEYLSVDDIARKEIEASPLKFSIDLSESRNAWERAQLFLNSYAGGHKELLTANSSRLVGNSAQGCTYEVQRHFMKDSYLFEVRCLKPSAEQTSGLSYASADLNARNFARFIRDGMLEVSLIK